MGSQPESSLTRTSSLENLIFEVRGHKVMLDADLARVYGVATKALNQAAKRNIAKFPPDFMFRLTDDEARVIQRLRSQFVTLKRGQHLKYLPYAFTEHGAIMAANVLNSPRAVQMSVFVVRAFVRMRAALAGNCELARKLAALEKELRDRLNLQDAVIVDILRRLMDIIDPPAPPEPPPKRIGFHVKEKSGRYRPARNRKPVAQTW
jgi:phage regulator Rha-like protein